MRRLLPEPAIDLDPAVAYAANRPRQGGRPWVLTNMVASIDGGTAVDGRSGGLGGRGDRQVFSTLRSLADVVLVGAATVRAEHYGPGRPGQRIAVVTRRADLDWSWELFTSGAAIVVTTEEAPELPVPTLRAGRGDVDLAAALALLDADVVLAEGGPTLNAQLLDADLVDEMCLTMAPLAIAGTSARIAHGPVILPSRFRLAHLLAHEEELYLRYLRDRDAASA